MAPQAKVFSSKSGDLSVIPGASWYGGSREPTPESCSLASTGLRTRVCVHTQAQICTYTFKEIKVNHDKLLISKTNVPKPLKHLHTQIHIHEHSHIYSNVHMCRVRESEREFKEQTTYSQL